MPINTPRVVLRNLPAFVPVTLEQQRLLFITQKTATGTAIEGELYQSLESDLDYETLAGKDSIGAAMIKAAQSIIVNSQIKPQFDAIFFNDAGGSVAATGTIAFSGTSASADATIYVSIGDSEEHRYELDVTATDTPTDIGDALEALITADDTSTVTAVNTTGSVALTAVNKGTVGNDITLQVEGHIPGITLTITQMASGSGIPTITGVPATIENIRYQTIVMPISYSVDTIATFLDTRWEPTATGIIKDGALIVCKTDTLANFKASTTAQNKKIVSIFPNKFVSLLPSGVADLYVVGSAHCQMDHVIASKIAAIRALRLTAGADIVDYINAGVDSNDNTGGPHIATLPYHNIPLATVPLADKRNAWAESELIELADAGYAIFGNNLENTAVILGDVKTRYKTNTLGQTDPSYKYLNYLDQASVVREYMTDNLKARFKNYRLTTGALVPNFNSANAALIESECVKLYGELANLMLMVKGEDARKLFIDALQVIIDEAAGRATVTMINPAVTQLREIDGTIRLVFTT